jgi:NAD+ diphosphatase
MIQDIAPRQLDNSFAQKPVKAESYILSFKEGTVLMNNDPKPCFPRFSELACDSLELTYLFCIDEADFFLASPESTPVPPGFSYQEVPLFRTMEPQYLAFAGMTALHLSTWYTSNKYCGRCGEPLKHSEKERMLACPACGLTVYPRISPVVIVGIYRGDELLLTRYAGRPYKGYALVAGFVEIGESVEEAVLREIKEEVGLDVKSLRYYKSQPWGFSESLIMGFFVELDHEQDIALDTTELSEANWIHRDNMADIEPDNISLTKDLIFYFKDHPEAFTSAQ